MPDFSQKLLAWHDANARELPWRGETNPYRIWVSEIMLQQTRTETVGAYYCAFLDALPTVRALADAPSERVLKLWEGLGYYSRARNLHRAARLVADEMGGKLPDTLDALRCLPGVGEYTAGAIASIAFGRKTLAMDGNVRRVLSRVLGVREPVDSPNAKSALREGGLALMPDGRPGDFNQAMMGLGNLICTPTRPDCAACPVSEHCDAFAAGDQASLPVLLPKPEKREESRAVALAFSPLGVLLRKRPEDGLLGGLWEFPNFLDVGSAAAVAECLREMGVHARSAGRLADARHVFTHRVWKMRGYAFDRAQAEETEALRFADAEALNALPMPTAMKVYREIAMARLNGEDNG